MPVARVAEAPACSICVNLVRMPDGPPRALRRLTATMTYSGEVRFADDAQNSPGAAHQDDSQRLSDWRD